MKKVSLFVVLVAVVSLLAACAGFDNSIDSSGRYDSGSYAGHSHH